MKNQVLILFVFAFIAGSCTQATKKQAAENQENMLTSAMETAISENADSLNIECVNETSNFEIQYRFEAPVILKFGSNGGKNTCAKPPPR